MLTTVVAVCAGIILILNLVLVWESEPSESLVTTVRICSIFFSAVILLALISML